VDEILDGAFAVRGLVTGPEAGFAGCCANPTKAEEAMSTPHTIRQASKRPDVPAGGLFVARFVMAFVLAWPLESMIKECPFFE
jgi:hypothetical protein